MDSENIEGRQNSDERLIIRQDLSIVSVLSLIIAALALLVSLANFYLYYQQQEREKERIKYEQPNLAFDHPYINVFFASNNQDGAIPLKNRIAVFVRIQNLSEKPITITKFSLKTPDFLEESDGSKKAPPNPYIIYSDSEGDKTLPIGEKQLVPIVVIEPWGAKEGFVFFLTSESIPEKVLEGTLGVFTTRGIFSTDVIIINPVWYYSNPSESRVLLPFLLERLKK